MRAYWTWTSALLGLCGVLACSGSSFSSNGSGVSGGGTSGSGPGGTSSGGAAGTGGGIAPPSGATGAGGFDTSGVQCASSPPQFPSFDKGCTDTTNCVLVSHETNCCGSILMMGINHAEADRFAALESLCESQYPACGCAASGVSAEDGTTVPLDSQSKIVVTCDNGTCMSQYSGQTIQCGDSKVCTDMQYCSVVKSATTGSATYDCLALPSNCTGCGCFTTQVTCTCTQSNGVATLICPAP